MLHVPSVNHPYFNQYLLHNLKEKLIEAVTFLAKRNFFLQKSQEKNKHKHRQSSYLWHRYTLYYCFNSITHSKNDTIQILLREV